MIGYHIAMWKRFVVLAVVLFAVGKLWTSRSITYGPGIVAEQSPSQQKIAKQQTFDHDGYTITPLAQFQLEARVLSVARYRFDREAALSPVDLALGWGPMSDEAVLDQISISQSNRFYFWEASQLPISKAEITENSANMHLIPANDRVEKNLKRIRNGHIVRIQGMLVEVRGQDGWQWKSSTTRMDTGNGACELIWVEDLSLTDRR